MVSPEEHGDFVRIRQEQLKVFVGRDLLTGLAILAHWIQEDRNNLVLPRRPVVDRFKVSSVLGLVRHGAPLGRRQHHLSVTDRYHEVR